MRPNPQLSQHANADTQVTKAMAAAGVLGREASEAIALFSAGADARADPETRTKAICMAKASSPHTPPPQLQTTSTGVCRQMGIASRAATKVSIMAKRNGSGIHRCTSFTEPLISFWNILEGK